MKNASLARSSLLDPRVYGASSMLSLCCMLWGSRSCSAARSASIAAKKTSLGITGGSNRFPSRISYRASQQLYPFSPKISIYALCWGRFSAADISLLTYNSVCSVLGCKYPGILQEKRSPPDFDIVNNGFATESTSA